MLTRRLCAACETGNFQVVKGLIEQRGITPNYPSADKDGRTPLHFAAEKLHADIVEYLLEHRASAHCSDRFGLTPLARACLVLGTSSETTPNLLKRGTKVLNALREHGADFRTRDKFGNSIIHLLSAKAKRDPFIFLSGLFAKAEEVASIGGENMNTLEVSRVSLFLLPGWGLLTPLHVASEAGNVDVLQYILEVMSVHEENGLLVNVIDAIGWSPLHWAVLKNDVECCRLLIRHGAYIHQRDYMSREPLDVALTFHRIEAARFLSHTVSACAALQVSPRTLDTRHHPDTEHEKSHITSSSAASRSLSSPATSSSSTSDTNQTMSRETSSTSTQVQFNKIKSTHHFLLISSSLAVVICSAAEVGLRDLSILATSSSKYGKYLDFIILLGPSLITSIFLFLSKFTPTKVLPCLRRWSHETKHTVSILVDLVICLAGLCSVKCGPLIIAHSLLLEERHAADQPASEMPTATPLESHLTDEQHISKWSEEGDTAIMPPLIQNNAPPKRNRDEGLLDAASLSAFQLVNQHSAPKIFPGKRVEEAIAPRDKGAPSTAAADIRAELRPEWCPLYQPIVDSVKKLFTSAGLQLNVPYDYALIALWIFQSLLTGSKGGGNLDSSHGGPLSTTSETMADLTPQDLHSSNQSASNVAAAASSWAPSSSASSSSSSQEEWSEPSSHGPASSPPISASESDQIFPKMRSPTAKLTVTQHLFPGMDADTRRHLISSARHSAPLMTTSSGASSDQSGLSSLKITEDESLLSSSNSSSSHLTNQTGTVSLTESASSEKEVNSLECNVSSSSQYTDPVSESALPDSASSPYKDPVSDSAAQNPSQNLQVVGKSTSKLLGEKLDQILLSGTTSGRTLAQHENVATFSDVTAFPVNSILLDTKHYKEATDAGVPRGTLVGNPLLNAFALRGLSRQFFAQSFVIWLREFQKMAAFLKEKPRLCVPIHQLASSMDSARMTPTALKRIFEKRMLAEMSQVPETERYGERNEESLGGFALLDQILTFIKRESLLFVNRQCTPPFIDLDVLSRETRHRMFLTPLRTHIKQTAIEDEDEGTVSSISIRVSTGTKRSGSDTSSQRAQSADDDEEDDTKEKFTPFTKNKHVPKRLELSYAVLVLVPCLLDLGFASSYLIFYKPILYAYPLITLLFIELILLFTFTLGCLFRC